MVVCVSGDTQAISALIDTYMGALVPGRVQLSAVHGLTQTATKQMYLIIPEITAMLVTEMLGGCICYFEKFPNFYSLILNEITLLHWIFEPTFA